MNIHDLLTSYKRYSLFERGMTVQSHKSIQKTLEWLCAFTSTNRLRDMNTGVIREFLNHMRQERGWSPKTYRIYRQNLKSFFEWCIKMKYVRKNPVDEIEKPKLPRRLPRSLTKEQMLQVLSHTAWHNWSYGLQKSRNEAIIATFALTGLRLAELINLKVNDVNFENESIFVREGKGRKDRVIPIHPRLMPILRGYFEERQRRLGVSQWFFTGIRSDKKLRAKDIQEFCRIISAASEIKFTPHMLRHTFGRLSVDADLQLYKLKEIMGHSDVSTTQIYLSVSDKSLKESFSKISLI